MTMNVILPAHYRGCYRDYSFDFAIIMCALSTAPAGVTRFNMTLNIAVGMYLPTHLTYKCSDVAYKGETGEDVSGKI